MHLSTTKISQRFAYLLINARSSVYIIQFWFLFVSFMLICFPLPGIGRPQRLFCI